MPLTNHEIFWLILLGVFTLWYLLGKTVGDINDRKNMALMHAENEKQREHERWVIQNGGKMG